MSSTVAPSPSERRGDPDRIAELATEVVGGPLGRLAARPRPQVHLAVTAALLSLGACLTVALGFLQKSYCVRHGWGAPQVYWKACYSDLPRVVVNDGLISGNPYLGADPLSDPPLTGMVLHALSAVAPADGLERQQYFFVGWAILAALLTVVTVAATVWTSRRRPELAAHVAVSPLLVTVALVSSDLVGVALAAVAVWLWSRSRPTAAGVVFGLAMAARVYPIVLLVALGALAVRAGSQRAWARTAGVALVTAVAAFGIGAILYGNAALRGFAVWAGATAQLGSPWYLATLWERPIHVSVLTVLTVLGWVLALAAGVALSLSAPVRPRFGEVALVVVAIVLLTGKALPIQSSLWLVPLVALAGLRWRHHLIWAATEVLSFVAVWLYLGGQGEIAASLPKEWYAFFLVLRLVGIGWLATAAASQAMRRRGGPLHPEVDDAAGVMTGRPDAVVIRYER